MNMKAVTVKAFIERGRDGGYGVYIDLNENRLNYSVSGDGKTAKDAVENFMSAYDDMKAFYEEKQLCFRDINFLFEYDVASFLDYYSGILTFSGLEKITGINQKQLHHYAVGYRRPRPNTTRKIEEGLRRFSGELAQVRFNN